MIAIVFYAILAGLIVIAAFISNRLIKIFGWSLSPNKLFLLHSGVFVGILCILFFDHIVGVIQFKYLCRSKMAIELASNWKEVKRAKLGPYENLRLGHHGYMIPVSCAKMKYQDADTGKTFLSFVYCDREAGVLFRKLAWDSSSIGDSCFPKNSSNIAHMVNLNVLLKKGERNE